MKKIISSKSWLLINLCGTFCISLPFVYFLFMFLQSVSAKEILLWLIFCIVMIASLLMLMLFIIALNRLSCIVWYDGISIGRKGLLFGFKHQIHVQEIKDVIVTSVPKQGQYVVVIDNFCNSDEGLSKKSYIRFEYTEKNREFYELLCRVKNKI